jgi:hypothetical protein
MIRQAGRIPAERYTTYQTKRLFDDSDEELDPLDVVGDNVEELFGSYQKLVNLDSYRFVHPRQIKLEPVGQGSAGRGSGATAHPGVEEPQSDN